MSLNSGADKIAINTHAIKNPALIMEASRIYGSQCIVGSIEAMKKSDNRWEAYTDNGREETGIDAIEWAKELENLGAGELIITSINQEGTNKGFDIELIKKISKNVTIPVIASGGAGKIGHINDVVNQTEVGAVAIASLLHYNIHDVEEIKTVLYQTGINIRI